MGSIKEKIPTTRQQRLYKIVVVWCFKEKLLLLSSVGLSVGF
jgi:hypothetical protein